MDEEDKLIHKRKLSRYLIAEDALCGRWIQYAQGSYLWKNVTCKNCLKKNG